MTVDAGALEQLKTLGDVVSIEEDIAVPPTLAESVPVIGAPAAWAAGYTGLGQTVAILDTGVDKTHSFLSGKVVSEACYSSNTLAASTVCPGGATASTSTGSGVNCPTSIDGCNHGTHVAGIAAGKGSSFSGVAKDANIIAIQVFSRFDSSTDCKTHPTPCALTYSSDQMSGLERVYALRSTYNIAAVNMSLGGGRKFSNCDSDNPSYKAAIDNLRSVGIATVISSGNDGYKDSIGSPACISSAISVGATGDGSGSVPLNAVASFSNSATFLSLLAPGNLINSSIPSNSFSNFQGTSMAAPHVAGAWAVIKSKKPTATVDEVFTALRDTGLPVTDTNGITKPRIKLDAAINTIGGGPGCPTTPIAVGQTIGGTLSTSDCRYPIGSSWYSDGYSFNGTTGQQVAIAMSSSSFDTWLTLIGPNGLELVNNNDGGGGTDSRIPATSGFYTLPSSGTFIIQATSNFTNATGSYTLSLTGSSTGVPNNNFANAQVINGSTGSVTGNNTGATKEFGEPSHAGNTGGASVWYRWQAPASGPVTMTTAGSNFDTLLAVYTGNSVSALTTIASNDDASPSDLSSHATFNVVGGTIYRIAVDGYSGATGSVVLNWNRVPVGPPNNNFANAQVISGNSGSINGNNTNATKEAGEPDHAGDGGGVSVWYRWQPSTGGTVTITTAGSNFDTLLAVYTGASVSSLTPLVSNDDEAFPTLLTSKVTFNAVSGTTYRIAVDGFAGSTGAITLTWNLTGTCNAPGAFSLTLPSSGQSLSATTSVTLSWGASANANSYDVYFGTSSNPPFLANQTGTSRLVTVTPGQTYYWKVVAKVNCGSATSTTTIRSFSVQVCNAPAAFLLNTPTNGQILSSTTSVSLVWGGSANANSYDVYFGTSSNPPFLANQTGTSRLVTVTPGQTYYWKVVAKVNCSSATSTTAIRSFAIGSATPPPLQLLLEQFGSPSSQVAALDSISFLRDPFPVLNGSDLLNLGVDRNTRVILFATNLQLTSGQTASLVKVSGLGTDIPADDVRPVANSTFTQVIFRLPSNLSTGTYTIQLKAPDGRVSNSGTIRIRT